MEDYREIEALKLLSIESSVSNSSLASSINKIIAIISSEVRYCIKNKVQRCKDM